VRFIRILWVCWTITRSCFHANCYHWSNYLCVLQWMWLSLVNYLLKMWAYLRWKQNGSYCNSVGYVVCGWLQDLISQSQVSVSVVLQYIHTVW